MSPLLFGLMSCHFLFFSTGFIVSSFAFLIQRVINILVNLQALVNWFSLLEQPTFSSVHNSTADRKQCEIQDKALSFFSNQWENDLHCFALWLDIQNSIQVTTWEIMSLCTVGLVRALDWHPSVTPNANCSQIKRSSLWWSWWQWLTCQCSAHWQHCAFGWSWWSWFLQNGVKHCTQERRWLGLLFQSGNCAFSVLRAQLR